MAGVVSDVSIIPVDEIVHREVLDEMQIRFLKDLIFDSVHDFFVTKGAFDQTTLDDIRQEQKNSGKIRQLLDHLKKANKKTYQLFKQGLHQTKQEHLVEALEETEISVKEKLKRERARTKQPTSDEGDISLRNELQSVSTTPIAQPTPAPDALSSFKPVHQD